MRSWIERLWCIFLIGTLTFEETIADQYVSVQTAEGVVQGKRVNLSNNKKSLYQGNADVFLGIPYAQPPVREKRFMPPTNPSPMTGVYNATVYKSLCVQPNAINTSEDCLYLNVFCQNALNYTALSAVIVFIDGNAQLSSGGLGQQEEKGIVSNLVQKGVIVVTIQYRLGPLGFFAAPTDMQVSSNLGMQDQVKALQWVNRNIAAFGGDTNRVSLAGQAGGACAVAAHTYSPMSQGLFQQAILQSGSIQSCYTTDRDYNGVSSTGGSSLQYDQGLPFTPLNGNDFQMTTTTTRSPDSMNTISNPSQLLATQLCNISPDQWRRGELNGLRECLQNYTIDVFTRTDGIHTATWMIVRDNLFMSGSLQDLANRRPPIPIIIGTVQDEDADYAFKLVNQAAGGNGTEADAFNNWWVDFAKKNKLTGNAAEQAKNIVSTNYNVTLPSSSNGQSYFPSQPMQDQPQQPNNAPYFGQSGYDQNWQNNYDDTTTQRLYQTTPPMIYGPPPGTNQNYPQQYQPSYPSSTSNSPALRDQNGRLNNTAMFHTLSVITNVSSDAGTVSQIVTEVDSWVQNGNRYVHVYRFEHRSKLGSPAAFQMLKGYDPIPKGQDKLFLFMKEDVWTKQKPTSADRAMADTIGQQWTDFAKQGSINNWSPVQVNQPAQLQSQTPYCSLSTQPTMQSGYGSEARQVFNQQVYPLAAQAQSQSNPRQYDYPPQTPNTVGSQWNQQLQNHNPSNTVPQVHVSNNGGPGSSWSMSFSLNDFRYPTSNQK